MLASLRTLWQLGSSLLLLVQSVRAQVAPSRPLPRVVALDSVAVAPQAKDSQGWLLLDHNLQTELEGAVENLYNFQFERAEEQFRSLRRRQLQHPLPYSLLALEKLAPIALPARRYALRSSFLRLPRYGSNQGLRAAARRLANYEFCSLLDATYGYEVQVGRPATNLLVPAALPRLLGSRRSLKLPFGLCRNGPALVGRLLRLNHGCLR